MRILIFVLGVIAATAGSKLKFDPPEMVHACFREINYNGETITELNWSNRLFICFHACMMEKRGEMENGKVKLDTYLANLEMDYFQLSGEDSKLEVIECALEANDQEDKCEVAGLMGKCVSEKWNIIMNEGK